MGGLCQTAFWRTERVRKIWLATLSAWPFPITAFDPSKTAASALTGRTTLTRAAPQSRLWMQSSSSAAFLLHVLPSGLVRIRQFGFLANRIRASKLKHCLALFAVRLPIQTGSRMISRLKPRIRIVARSVISAGGSLSDSSPQSFRCGHFLMRPGGLIVGALQGSHPALDPVVHSDALLPGKTRRGHDSRETIPPSSGTRCGRSSSS